MKNHTTKGANLSPFLNHAPKYWDMGLPVFPTGDADGKKPQILGWSKYKNAPSTRTQNAWLKNHPNANLGMVTGNASGIIVIDIDDDYPLEFALEEFGHTSCIVRTPRGGYHLYYRYNGESRILRYQGRKLDILADGGFVMLPPSFNPKLQKPYAFIEGSLLDFPELNILNADVIPSANTGTFHLPDTVSEGNRNKTLYNALRAAVFNGYNEHQRLVDYALHVNQETMNPPLDDKEVLRTVKSIWTYYTQGNLVPPNRQYANLWEEQLENLKPPAYMLYGVIKKNHEGLRCEFALEQKAMAKKLGVSLETLRKAIKELIKQKLIIQTYTGGKKKGDPHLYTFFRV